MKHKFKVISFIMAATLLVSTAAVLAASTSAEFGAGESSGTARLESRTTWSRANTYPTYAPSYRVSTYIAGTTGAGTVTGSGSTEAYITAARFNGASSTHSIDGITKHLSVRSD